jgi:hypothetical protein
MLAGRCLGTVGDNLNGKRLNREIMLIDHGLLFVGIYH